MNFTHVNSLNDICVLSGRFFSVMLKLHPKIKSWDFYIRDIRDFAKRQFANK